MILLHCSLEQEAVGSTHATRWQLSGTVTGSKPAPQRTSSLLLVLSSRQAGSSVSLRQEGSACCSPGLSSLLCGKQTALPARCVDRRLQLSATSLSSTRHAGLLVWVHETFSQPLGHMHCHSIANQGPALMLHSSEGWHSGRVQVNTCCLVTRWRSSCHPPPHCVMTSVLNKAGDAAISSVSRPADQSQAASPITCSAAFLTAPVHPWLPLPRQQLWVPGRAAHSPHASQSRSPSEAAPCARPGLGA